MSRLHLMSDTMSGHHLTSVTSVTLPDSTNSVAASCIDLKIRPRHSCIHHGHSSVRPTGTDRRIFSRNEHVNGLPYNDFNAFASEIFGIFQPYLVIWHVCLNGYWHHPLMEVFVICHQRNECSGHSLSCARLTQSKQHVQDLSLNVQLLTVMSRMSGIDDFVPSFIVSLLTVQQILEEFLPEN